MKESVSLLNQSDSAVLFENSNCCIIVPTYNNQNTLARVINSILKLKGEKTDLIVVNDGSTDETSKILTEFESKICLISYSENQGKGYALRQGFKKAIELGYDHALTFDSDGQHYPDDIPTMLQKINEHPNSVIMGSRNMEQDGVPGKSSFGNKFSNFWFLIETLIQLPDTQTGFRIYPLNPMKKMRFFTKKFEFEIEIIVRLAWKFVPFHAVPIQVKYDPEERVSHFRPGRDFFRISVLNSVLVFGALFYFFPKKLFSRDTLRMIKHEAIKPEETNFMKALSLGFGVFMGVVPIWGFQLLIGIPLSILFRMNKVLFITAANISIPPMIPFIIYSSLLVGQFFVAGELDYNSIWDFSLESIKTNLYQYVIGAIILAIILFGVVFSVSYLLLHLFRKPIDKQR